MTPKGHKDIFAAPREAKFTLSALLETPRTQPNAYQLKKVNFACYATLGMRQPRY